MDDVLQFAQTILVGLILIGLVLQYHGRTLAIFIVGLCVIGIAFLLEMYDVTLEEPSTRDTRTQQHGHLHPHFDEERARRDRIEMRP